MSLPNDGCQSFLITESVPIGEILFQNNRSMLKMWSVAVKNGARKVTTHSHSRFEISVCQSGSGEYTVGKTLYDILPGDVFVFSSNEQHCITKAGENGLQIMNLHFDPRCLLSENPGGYNDQLISFCFSHSPNFENRIPAEKSVFIQNALSDIKDELLLGDANQYIAILSHLNLILVDLLRNHKYHDGASPVAKEDYSYLLSVYNYIDLHLDEELTLNAIAETAGYSPNYFSHIFKKINGISLWDYITAKRIEKASRMLLSNDSKMTILNIASECGFNNTINFNKAFKRIKGVTPSEFRKNPNLQFH